MTLDWFTWFENLVANVCFFIELRMNAPFTPHIAITIQGERPQQTDYGSILAAL